MMINNRVRNVMGKPRENDYEINGINALDNLLLLIRNTKPTKKMTQEKS